MNPGDDDLRDAHLLAALRHAPDHDALPDARVSQAILDQARRALATAAPLPTQVTPGWRAWWNRWSQRGWQPAPMAAFGSLAMAAVIGLLWQGQELPEPAPSLRPASTPAARPAESDVRASADAAVALPQAQAPAPPAPGRALAPQPRAAPRESQAAPPDARADAAAKRPEATDRALADTPAQASQAPQVLQATQAPQETAKAARGEAGAAEARARSAAPMAPMAPMAPPAPPAPPALAAAANETAAPLASIAAAIEASAARAGASVVWRVATPQRDVDHAALQRSWWNALQAATEGRWQVARPTDASTRGPVVLLIDGRAQGEIRFEAQALVWRDAAGSAYRAVLPQPTVRELQEAVARW